MKFVLIKLLAVFALASIVNAAVIEPAICLSHDSAATHQQENEDSCFVCQPFHYQGANFSPFQMQAADVLLPDSVSLLNLPLSESPVRSIFHPPHAF